MKLIKTSIFFLLSSLYQVQPVSLASDYNHAYPGGIIAKALQNCLGLSDKIMIKFLLASMNTGVTILNYSNGQFNVEQINALPHLDHSSRIRSRTYF